MQERADSQQTLNPALFGSHVPDRKSSEDKLVGRPVERVIREGRPAVTEATVVQVSLLFVAHCGKSRSSLEALVLFQVSGPMDT